MTYLQCLVKEQNTMAEKVSFEIIHATSKVQSIDANRYSYPKKGVLLLHCKEDQDYSEQ